MAMSPHIRQVQSSLAALGFSPGLIDGWWGRKTRAAALALLSAQTSLRNGSVAMLQSGLSDLGYDPGGIDDRWGPRTRAALSALLRAEGVPKASLIGVTAKPQPAGSAPAVQARGTILQGLAKTVITGFMMHTSATGGSWWLGKTHQQMFDEVRSWHVTPVSKGDRGAADSRRGAASGVSGDGGLHDLVQPVDGAGDSVGPGGRLVGP